MFIIAEEMFDRLKILGGGRKGFDLLPQLGMLHLLGPQNLIDVFQWTSP